MKEQYDALIESITRDRYDILEARKEYQKHSGEIYEDDKSYEARMGMFLEWFVFDRLLPGTQNTLLEKLLQGNGAGWAPHERRAYETFSGSVHGLFIPKKIKDTYVVVLNLFDNTKYTVKENQGKILFNKDDIFEGRLVPMGEDYFFSGCFCFHPDGAGRYIRDKVKAIVAVQEGHKKTLKGLNSNLNSCESRMDKNAREIDKLNAKIAKTDAEAKLKSLNEKLDALKTVRSELHQEKSALESDKQHLETQKMKIEFREACNLLMQRLGYMNLKWERSRQIDLNDIYRD